jgi:hypothetical protein
MEFGLTEVRKSGKPIPSPTLVIRDGQPIMPILLKIDRVCAPVLPLPAAIER